MAHTVRWSTIGDWCRNKGLQVGTIECSPDNIDVHVVKSVACPHRNEMALPGKVPDGNRHRVGSRGLLAIADHQGEGVGGVLGDHGRRKGRHGGVGIGKDEACGGGPGVGQGSPSRSGGGASVEVNQRPLISLLVTASIGHRWVLLPPRFRQSPSSPTNSRLPTPRSRGSW